LAATQTPVKLSPFNLLTRLARVDMIDILESVSSSTHVTSYSGSQPTKGEARFMIFAIKPLLVPFLEGRFQGEVEKIMVRVSLNANTRENLG
jgi:hypothetical protein